MRKSVHKLNRSRQANTFTLNKDESNLDDGNEYATLGAKDPTRNVREHKLKARESPFFHTISHTPYLSNKQRDNHSPEFGTPGDKISTGGAFKHKNSLMTPPVYSNFLSAKKPEFSHSNYSSSK